MVRRLLMFLAIADANSADRSGRWKANSTSKRDANEMSATATSFSENATGRSRPLA